MRKREDAPRHQEPHFPALASDVGAATAGALLGVAVGGPMGAIAGAAVGPMAKTALEIASASIKTRSTRIRKTLSLAAEMIDSRQSLEELLLRDETRLDLAIMALDAAASSSLESKLSALATAIAKGSTTDNDLELERIKLVVRAINAIDRIHILALQTLHEKSDSHASTPDELAAATGVPAEELRQVVRQLELYGLIVDESRLTGLTGEVQWKLSDLGSLCIALLNHRQSTTEAEQ